MATLKDFENALRQQGMTTALAILESLRQRDRANRSVAPPRRVSGRKMTPELARRILELHGSTKMTQQEIAFQLGVNQGRVNEVIKRGKWLDGNPNAPEALIRDKAMARARTAKPKVFSRNRKVGEHQRSQPVGNGLPRDRAQLSFGDL